MEDVEKLVKTTLGEIEKVLGSKTVIGEPLTIGDSMLIPLLSVGHSSEVKQQDEGTSGGSGIKPIAVIIVDKNGARIEPIRGGMASAIEKIGETVPEMMARFAEKWGERKEKQKES